MLVPVLRDADELPGPAERDDLSRASTLAGQAIDITRTTAAHAMSYPLTAYLGIPHGLACALNLTWLVPLVEAARPEQVVDERGPAAVREAIDTVRSAFNAQHTSLADVLRTTIDRRVAQPYGEVPRSDAELMDLLVAEGLSSNRMTGTPVRLERTEARAGLETIFPAVVTARGTGCATTG